jgi:hypothetical protein
MNDQTLWNDWGDGDRTEGTPESKTPSLGGDWGDGERTPATNQQSTRQDAKAFPLGADWGERKPATVEVATPEGENNPIGYLGEIPESFSDEDVAIVGTFFSGLEGKVAPEVGQELLQRYDAFVEAADEQEAAGDKAACKEAVASLRKTWGDDYETNIACLNASLAGQPFRDDFLSARFPDGKALFNDPAFARWLFDLTDTA